jgi:hypothetical protein
VELHEIPQNLEQTFVSKGFALHRGGDLELLVEVDDVVSLNSFLDALRSEGLLITSVRQKRRTLEDMFIDVVTGDGEASVQ